MLIDCPPHLGILTVNALAAADAVLVPFVPEFLQHAAYRPSLWSSTACARN
ncbi:AAA family ATPase [Candidatus Amarolinea dominans]|uniref:AAA family ATPase n=1 Tax=Candidatus Amarolinea dominans TaxID=3140696 RepID=UPI003137696D|nr:AAA family ATPase [Anaerolineae bacterium]